MGLGFMDQGCELDLVLGSNKERVHLVYAYNHKDH